MDAVKRYLIRAAECLADAEAEYTPPQLKEAEQYLLASLGGDRPLTEITRQDARGFRDLLRGRIDGRGEARSLKAGSINRVLNDVSAIFNHANQEFELGRSNPFKGLKLDEQEAKRDKRRSFTPTELQSYLAAFESGNDDARRCTILMAFTGARTSEICGLEVQDVRLADPIPHIIIRPNATHPHIKTSASRRSLPLAGAALDAAREAVAALKVAHGPLFPRYAHGRGADSLSALQNKVIRRRLNITDPKLNAYSTRHTIKDHLRNALVPAELQDAIMGHNKGQVSDGYGDGYWLSRLKEALTAALCHVIAGDATTPDALMTPGVVDAA